MRLKIILSGLIICSLLTGCGSSENWAGAYVGSAKLSSFSSGSPKIKQFENFSVMISEVRDEILITLINDKPAGKCKIYFKVSGGSSSQIIRESQTCDFDSDEFDGKVKFSSGNISKSARSLNLTLLGDAADEDDKYSFQLEFHGEG